MQVRRDVRHAAIPRMNEAEDVKEVEDKVRG